MSEKLRLWRLEKARLAGEGQPNNHGPMATETKTKPPPTAKSSNTATVKKAHTVTAAAIPSAKVSAPAAAAASKDSTSTTTKEAVSKKRTFNNVDQGQHATSTLATSKSKSVTSSSTTNDVPSKKAKIQPSATISSLSSTSAATTKSKSKLAASSKSTSAHAPTAAPTVKASIPPPCASIMDSSAMEEVIPSPAPVVAPMMEEDDDDDDDDLGISLSSVDVTPPPSVSTTRTVALTSNMLGTPVASSLRAQLKELDTNTCEKQPTTKRATVMTPSAASSSAAITTPRAQQLREALRLSPPLARSTTHTATTAASVPPPTPKTHTPHAERLRDLLLHRRTPPPSTTRATSATPVASSLAAQLRMDVTPPDSKTSMAAIQSAARIASVPRVHHRTPLAARGGVSSTDSTPEPTELELGVGRKSHISPIAYLDSSVDTSVESVNTNTSMSEEAPVARNLIAEMDDLNASLTSHADEHEATSERMDSSAEVFVGSRDQSVTVDDHDAHAHDESADLVDVDSIGRPLALPSAVTNLLFQADEFIPGLSTPAPKLSEGTRRLLASPIVASSSTSTSMSTSLIFSDHEAFETSPMAHSTQPTPAATAAAAAAKHAKLLTPSRMQHELVTSTSTPSVSGVAGGTNVVYASVKAHPRDAARLGSATFLSPVRRSTRRSRGTPVATASASSSSSSSSKLASVPASSTASSSSSPSSDAPSDTPMDEMDQTALKRMLAANNWAYQPNPALAGELTPIPHQRATKRVTESVTVTTPTSATTPLTPSGSTVVLQAVRRRRSSVASASVVDPRSSEYLLSPVRRSARHTAPQSFSEVAKLLATTPYTFEPNPLITEDITITPSLDAATASILSPVRDGPLAAIHEEEDDEYDGEEQGAAVEASVAPTINTSLVSPHPAKRTHARTASVTRVGTPLPSMKTKSKLAYQPTMAQVPESLTMAEFDESYLDHAITSASASAAASSKLAASPSVRVHAKDADGFCIPLPIKKRATSSTKSSRGHKRKHTVDELEAKLSLVAVTMMEANGMATLGAPSSSSSSSTSATFKPVTRMSTPRPALKKTKRMQEYDQRPCEYEVEHTDQIVYDDEIAMKIAAASSTSAATSRTQRRVATPMK